MRAIYISRRRNATGNGIWLTVGSDIMVGPLVNLAPVQPWSVSGVDILANGGSTFAPWTQSGSDLIAWP